MAKIARFQFRVNTARSYSVAADRKHGRGSRRAALPVVKLLATLRAATEDGSTEALGPQIKNTGP